MNDEQDNQEQDYEEIYKNLVSRIQYLFTYGLPNEFSNVLKREASLSGDMNQDLKILVSNFLDFMVQVGFTVNSVISAMVEINKSTEDMEEPSEEDLEMIEKEIERGEENSKQQIPGKMNLILGKPYEDVDDVINDKEAFNNFIKQFEKKDNIIFRKTVFQSFLKDTIYE